MMKDEDWFKFKALKMSLLVDSEGVAVTMIEGTLLTVTDLSSPRFPYQIWKGTAVRFEEDPGRPPLAYTMGFIDSYRHQKLPIVFS